MKNLLKLLTNEIFMRGALKATSLSVNYLVLTEIQEITANSGATCFDRFSPLFTDSFRRKRERTCFRSAFPIDIENVFQFLSRRPTSRTFKTIFRSMRRSIGLV